MGEGQGGAASTLLQRLAAPVYSSLPAPFTSAGLCTELSSLRRAVSGRSTAGPQEFPGTQPVGGGPQRGRFFCPFLPTQHSDRALICWLGSCAHSQTYHWLRMEEYGRPLTLHISGWSQEGGGKTEAPRKLCLEKEEGWSDEPNAHYMGVQTP